MYVSSILGRMDVQFELQGVIFVWDETKATTNRTKHGVSFEQAAEVFFDPFVRVMDASVDGQFRSAAVGLDDHWNLLFVVHIESEGDAFRIISARRATPHERREYES